MKRWWPAPLLSAGLLALWLLLNQSLSAGHVLLGALAAWALPWLSSPLRPSAGAMRRPLTLLRLVLTVGSDVVRSGLQVAFGVLRARRVPPSARFVVIPLELRDPVGLAALAMVTTVVPGTEWSELALDRSALLLHVWNVDDEEAAFVARFKARYEQPLREIFE